MLLFSPTPKLKYTNLAKLLLLLIKLLALHNMLYVHFYWEIILAQGINSTFTVTAQINNYTYPKS